MNNLSLTYKKIYNLFKGIAAAHPMIKDFNYGDIFDENREVDDNYPKLFLESSTQLDIQGSPNFQSYWQINFSVVETVTNTDTLADNFENISNSLSKTEQIGQSIINKLYELEPCNTHLSSDINAATLEGLNNAVEYGWRFSITLISSRSIDNCDQLLQIGDVCEYIKSC